MTYCRFYTFSALISHLIVVASVTLPPPTAPYNVGSTAYTTLNDPVAPTNITTSILLTFYYPTHSPAPSQQYVWEELAAYYDAYYSLPTGAFGNITANIAYNAPPLSSQECEKLHLQTLLWNPPAAGPPSQLFLGLISEMVSRGYAVVSVDHPYEPPYLECPDGTSFTGHAVDWSPPEEVLLRLHEYRVTDNYAMLDALPKIATELSIPLNITHFAFFGHSIGGSVALTQVLAERNRTASRNKKFLGAVNLDGTIWPGSPAAANSSSVDIHVPALLMAGSTHLRVWDPSWPLFESFQTSWRKELRVLGETNHTDYSDLIFMKQANGVAGGDGAVTAERMLQITRTFVGDFFAILLGGGECVLKGDEEVLEMWPEVVFEYNGTGDPCAKPPDLCWASYTGPTGPP